MELGKFRKWPVVGAMFLIMNAYAFKGDPRYVSQLAPWVEWKKHVVPKAVISMIVSFFLTISSSLSNVDASQSSVVESIISIFPSLLGFGIGVFALIFVLPSGLIEKLEQRKEAAGFDARILPPDMAYPLLVLALALASAVIMDFLPETWLGYLLLVFFLVYGLLMIIELISMIFHMAYRSIKAQQEKDGEPGGS